MFTHIKGIGNVRGVGIGGSIGGHTVGGHTSSGLGGRFAHSAGIHTVRSAHSGGHIGGHTARSAHSVSRFAHSGGHTGGLGGRSIHTVRSAHSVYTCSARTRFARARFYSFPCLDRAEQRTQQIKQKPVQPEFQFKNFNYQVYKHDHLDLEFGTQLKNIEIAYETWGTLNKDKSNAILLHTGLSPSSHAKSHSLNTNIGWWEKFIGPGLAIDTDKFFVVCTNALGSCFGSTGPSSFVNGVRYGTNFPIITIQDMVKVQHALIKSLGIEKLHASVGSSMGGMQSLAYATLFPNSLKKLASISGAARSHPSSIASRFAQRQILMNDPHWNRGFYYDGVPPHQGMKLAREVATITYRSGPEWEQRFARDRMDPDVVPALCPDFLIETYLDHQGEKFCLQYDPNSLLYLSKAMDLFDLGLENSKQRKKIAENVAKNEQTCSAVPKQPIKKRERSSVNQSSLDDLVAGMKPMAHLPTFVLGVVSDALFPSWQQREIYDVLKRACPTNTELEYHELGLDKSLYGHDTFLLDLENVGMPLKRFLERSTNESRSTNEVSTE